MASRIHFKHFYEGIRKVSIAYTFNKTSGEVCYGAVVFRETPNSRGSWNKKTHRRTAFERFSKSPVVFFIAENEKEDIKYREIEKRVRRYMFSCGTKSYRKESISN